ncbi:HNH endonuclease [Streptomyces lavendulae]|uniref:HNH endonuclease n=1 Tax=Streptomyces lavendulae TaxID=1914 RepID=UPI0033F7C0EB
MAITEKSTKILWGRSGGLCTICRVKLVISNEVAADDHSVIGEMAHIVAQSPDGPRGHAEFSGDRDHHSNLILLCRVHHKVVDDQVNGWTVQRLQEQKASHEKWVTETLSFEPVRIRPDPEGEDPNTILFYMIESGNALWGLVTAAWSHQFSHSEGDRTDEQIDSLMDLFDELADWMDIAHAVETMRQQRDTRKRMQEILEESVELGFLLYGRRIRMLMTGGVDPMPTKHWHVEIRAVRIEDFAALVEEHLAAREKEPLPGETSAGPTPS